jgi:hypothetical protein
MSMCQFIRKTISPLALYHIIFSSILFRFKQKTLSLRSEKAHYTILTKIVTK